MEIEYVWLIHFEQYWISSEIGLRRQLNDGSDATTQ